MVNHSLEGFLAEKELATRIINTAGIKQKLGLRNYQVSPESVCVNLKLSIASEAITEQDVSFAMKRSSWVVNSLQKIFMVNDTENVGIQNKAYNSKVAFEKILKDIVHSLMTHQLNYNLRANTIIIVSDDGLNDNDSILEMKLKHQYNARIITQENLGQQHEVIKKIGNNKVSYSTLENNEWANQSELIGELTLLDEGRIFKKLKLINALPVKSINEETYNILINSLRTQQTYLNPEYYIYSATSGISPKGQAFLQRINATALKPDEIINLLNNKKFFQQIKRLDYTPFGIGKAVLGTTESNIYKHLDNLLYDEERHKLINYENLTQAVTKFLEQRTYIR